MKLNTTKIRAAESRERAYRMADGRGLSLLVTPTGSKLWHWSYRDSRGKQHTMSLGAFPEVTLEEARSRVSKERKVMRWAEPEPEPKKPTVTFAEAAREQMRIWETGKNAAHVLRVWNRLKQDAMPVLGPMPLRDIQPTDVVAVVRAVEERGALDVARRLKQKIGEVFGFAIAMGYCETDPTAHVNRVLRPKPAVQHMARVPLSEMPALVVALDSHPDELVRLGLRFTLLTVCRSAEVRGALWSEIGETEWVIPGSRMKMGRMHRVPLATQTQEVLAALKKHRRGEYLFPGPRRSVVNTNFLINGLYDLGGTWRGRQTIHGFRGLFSTWANEAGYRSDVIERCLAHVEGNEVRAAYNAAEWMDGRRKLMQDWADQIDAWRLEGVFG